MKMLRSLAAFAAGMAVAFAASAASVAARSPFTQGQWADPTRPGQGFELLSVGNQAMAIWFTFEESRNPVWYTAQGEIGATWTLLKHHWASGRRGASVAVGTLRIDFLNDSQADATFNVIGRTGTWRIEPFLPGAKTNDVDHSGSYFDPSNPGWGFTLTEQGDVLGGVLYAYNEFGFPTWVAGFARGGNGSVGMIGVRGPCPGCDPAPVERFDAGRIDIEFLTERQAALRAVLSEPLAVGLDIDGKPLSQLGRPAADRLADRVLASFPSTAALRSYLEAAMHNMGFATTLPPGSPSVVPSESALRLIDGDVEECDSVATAGSRIYAFGHDGVTRPMAHLRVAEVGRDGLVLDVRPDPVPLSSGFNTPTYAASLCAGADALASVTGTQPFTANSTQAAGYMKGRTYVEVFGLADPGRPASRWWAEIEGHPLTSFRIGDRLYVVVRYAPTVPGFSYLPTPAPTAANRQVLADSPMSVLVPQVRVNGGEQSSLVAPASTYLPQQGPRRRADHVAVVAVDLREPRVVDAIAILGSVEGVDVAGRDLFLVGGLAPGSGAAIAPRAQVYRIRLGASAMVVAGTGAIEGTVVGNAVHGSETGTVRVLARSTSGAARLNILEPGATTPEFLRVASTLPNASRSTPFADDVRAVRFVGERMYAATSGGQLNAVDFSDVLDPKVITAIDSRGPLESLHPLPDGRLLATGHEVGFFGLPADLHLTLYDLRDPPKPREVQRSRVGPGSSATPLLAEPAALSLAQGSDNALSIAFPARVPTAAGLMNGVAHFELRDPRSFNAGLVRLPDLLTPGEAAIFPGSRALLYPLGVIYVGAGRFWRQDIGGSASGPF